MQQPEIKCNTCGSIDWQHFRQLNDYHMWRCRSCQLIMLYPQPTNAELESLYGQNYFINHLEAQMPQANEDIEQEIQKRYHFVQWLEMTGKRRSGKVLEIGCATGFLLKALERRGWKVTGLEISAAAANYARDMLNLDVHTGQMNDTILGNESYDLIIMLHTFEHLPDPRQTLLQLRKHLSEQGIFVLQIPNARSLEARISEKNWEGWRIPYHLFHFSPAPLKRLLSECGYQIIIREFALPTFERKFLEKIVRRPTSLPQTGVSNASAKKAFRLRKWLLHLNKSLPIGRDITIIASKTEDAIKN